MYGFDYYADLLLTLCVFAYPFRLFLFAARFNQAKPIKVHLNTIVRTCPGIFVLVNIIFVVAFGFAVVYHILLGGLLPEMSDPLSALLFTTSQSLFNSKPFNTLVQQPTYAYFGILGFILQ